MTVGTFYRNGAVVRGGDRVVIAGSRARGVQWEVVNVDDQARALLALEVDGEQLRRVERVSTLRLVERAA